MENHEETASTSNGIEENGRSCRNKRRQLDPTICPVCSITIRSSEVNQHLACEIEKLYKISCKSKLINGKLSNSSPTNINDTENGIDKCWETYQKVRLNRQTRQRVKSRKRRSEEVICPVCNQETTEDITIHVERCLRRQSGEESDENIDVEGYEEYEWAGESRIRATTMFQGELSTLGTSISMVDDDEDLVVDGDDNHTYGSSQYTEKDIILPGSDKANDALRKAVVGENYIKLCARQNSSVMETVDSNDEPVVAALKSRIRELESKDGKDEIYKCLICMERYKTPVISVCCWHVHCELCWLQTLGAKKLCPQCNMITSPSDLRRIYI